MNSYSFWLARSTASKWLYTFLGALLFWLAFPPLDYSALIFVFLVPVLLIEDELFYSPAAESGRKLWWWSMAQFLLLNSLTLWWIKNAAWVGAIASVLANTLLMSLVVYLYHRMRRSSGDRYAAFGLVSLWIGYEFLHYSWDLDFPWLTLGNSFANHPSWIQWYDKTGVFGGSLWVLVVNLSLFYGIKNLLLRFNPQLDTDEKRYLGWNAARYFSRGFFLLLLPLVASWMMWSNYQPKGVKAEVAVVQPNFDPYNSKFDENLYQNQLDSLLSLTDKAMTPETRLVLWPETSIPGSIWLKEGDQNWQQASIRHFLSNYEGPALLVGASALTSFQQGEKVPDFARPHPAGGYYLPHNSALFYRNDQEPQVYHKSQLVIGVEKMPYPQILGFLGKLSVDLGGMTGTLGKQKERAVFENAGIKVAPVICYESVFGGYVTEYMRNGANLIGIITNDGWWGDTDGYRQHLAFARLRAIENRRDVARSANTGISAFINQRGELLGTTGWWEQNTLTAEVYLNEELSFYSRYGDYLGRTAAFLAILLVLIHWSKSRSKKGKIR